ncbi:MAG: hypothetical protein CSA50_06135 [Gammaproteobacteria bacterium]|nr:MAG: hypothetical protein CSA50_06135 [Gammaproteobacteria bacterium]
MTNFKRWPTLFFGLLGALAINIALFALIPYLAWTELPDSRPLKRQQVHFFKDIPELEEQRLKPEKPPKEPPPPPPPALEPARASPPQIIQSPLLSRNNLAQPRVPLVPGFKMMPLRHISGFYSLDDLDVKPRLSYRAPPIYPYRAKRMNISGHVRIRFDVGRDGRVSNIQILESEPPEIFDDAVLAAVSKWQFHPGELMGDTVATRMTNKIVFNLED